MSHLAALAAPVASMPTAAVARIDSLVESVISDLLLVGTWRRRRASSAASRPWPDYHPPSGERLHASQHGDKLSTNRQRFGAVDDRQEAGPEGGRARACRSLPGRPGRPAAHPLLGAPRGGGVGGALRGRVRPHRG